MANKTDPTARDVHNTNPQFLIEKIVRSKIYAHSFWKESCFGLNSETLVDRAIELKYIGGTYGGVRKPTKFLCLVLKMLQIQPEKEIIYEFLKAKDYKYVTALAMIYLRLIGKSEEVYQCLEPFYSDNRKIIRRKGDGRFEVIHMDEYVDELLNSDACLDIVLTRIPKRPVLEESGALEPRISALEEDLVEEEPEKPEEIIDKDKDIEEKKVMGLEKEDSNDKNQKKHRKHRKRSRSHSKHKDHKGKDKNNWRKIVKTKKSRSKSREKGKTEEKIDNQEKKQGKIEEFSVEYWNKLRAEIGLKPL